MTLITVYQRHLLCELGVRIILSAALVVSEYMHPRVRDIHAEEWWLYRNLSMPSYITFRMLWVVMIFNSFVFLLYGILHQRNRHLFLFPALLGYSLTILLVGICTNLIKLFVGRPRPDFFYRCFPNGQLGTECTGEEDTVLEGRKSFPSGHSSFAFACAIYTSLFFCGQFRMLAQHRSLGLGGGSEQKPDSNGAKEFKEMRSLPPLIGAGHLCLVLLPLACSCAVALSRLVDYHHHCEDVAIGALLGCIVGYLCYRIYFPSLSSPYCHLTLYEWHRAMLVSWNGVADGVPGGHPVFLRHPLAKVRVGDTSIFTT